ASCMWMMQPKRSRSTGRKTMRRSRIRRARRNRVAHRHTASRHAAGPSVTPPPWSYSCDSPCSATSRATAIDARRTSALCQTRDPRRPSAYRIAELVGTLGDAAVVEQWVRQLVFRIVVGDNDGHAKNVGILHEAGSDRLTDLYDAVPNLFQEGRVSWDMALAI